MKNLLIILSLFLLSFTASAQKVIRGGGGFHGGGYTRVYRPVISVGAYAPLYPYGFYSPFYNPYYYPDYSYRYPARLKMKLDAISDDYQQQIKETRHDKTMTGKERREKIRELKTEKARAIIDAKKDFFKDVHAN